jgi:DedD protein
MLSPSAKASAPAAAKPSPAPVAESAPAAGAPAVSTATTALPPAPPAKVEAPKASAPAAQGYVVQLAAFADDKGANALAGRLKRGGYAAYVEPLQTSRGTLWRVRVGGYATRAEADAASEKLKAEGQKPMVVPVR